MDPILAQSGPYPLNTPLCKNFSRGHWAITGAIRKITVDTATSYRLKKRAFPQCPLLYQSVYKSLSEATGPLQTQCAGQGRRIRRQGVISPKKKGFLPAQASTNIKPILALSGPYPLHTPLCKNFSRGHLAHWLIWPFATQGNMKPILALSGPHLLSTPLWEIFSVPFRSVCFCMPLQPFPHPGLLWPIWPISHSTPLYQGPKSFQSLPCCQWLQSLPPVLLALLLAKEICQPL